MTDLELELQAVSPKVEPEALFSLEQQVLSPSEPSV